MAPFPGFVGGSYTSQSPVSANEALINFYVEKIESPHGTAKAALYPTPGYRAFARPTVSGGRAAFANEDRCFVIFGNTLYEILSDGTATSRGTVAIDANPATICTNGDGGGELFITSGDRGYVYNLSTNTLTQVLASGATMGGMIDGYFVAFDRATSSFRISDLFDGLTWDPTQTASRTIGADDWQSMHVTPYGYVCLPGSKSGEFWYNDGSSPFPFVPDRAGLFEEGIAATFSIKQAGKSVVWLSTNANGGYQVMRATGFTPERISDHALEQAIASYANVSDAIGETYEDRGHSFYLLTFPQARRTWVYDFTTRIWAQRGTWESETNSFNYLRPVVHCFAFGKHLCADREGPVLYEMSASYGTDVENDAQVPRPIRRVRRSPAVSVENQRLFFEHLEVLMETGIGISDGDAQDEDPEVMLRISNDYGRTWGSERRASAGKIGQYSVRVQWHLLGSGRGRVYEVSVSANAPWRITDAFQKVRREAA